MNVLHWCARAYVLLCVCLTCFTCLAVAQDYPNRPIRIIVPFAPGASTDTMARAIAQRVTEVWPYPTVVENRPGASGMNAAQFVAKAPADGYTFLMATASTHNMGPHLFKSPGFDALKDFVPIALAAWVPNVLAVHPSLPVKNVKEFIALAQSRPGQLLFSSSGTGTTLHLAGELFKTMAKVDLVHVPYKGAGAAFLDLISGQVQVTFSTVNSTMPYVNQGRLRALAVTTMSRSRAMPQLPTISEAALPGYEMPNWIGLVAPANTPKGYVVKLNAEVVKLVSNEQTVKHMAALGAEMEAGTPEAFGKIMLRGYESMGRVIATAGLKPE